MAGGSASTGGAVDEALEPALLGLGSGVPLKAVAEGVGAFGGRLPPDDAGRGLEGLRFAGEAQPEADVLSNLETAVGPDAGALIRDVRHHPVGQQDSLVFDHQSDGNSGDDPDGAPWTHRK